jgi:hypothetical protein
VDTTAIRTAYERDGFVHLPGAFPADVAAELAARVRAAGRLAELRRADAFGPLATEVVRDAIGVVVGGSCPEPNDWGGALVTEPTIGSWQTPTGGSHLDYPVQGAPLVELRLKWFAHLEQVVHGGGAPVLIAGFHRLVAQWAAQTRPGDVGHSAAVRDSIFPTSPWFKVLRDRAALDREKVLAAGATVGGVNVRVVELTGAAGDVTLVHPHVLHAPSPNYSDRPRLMVTGGFEVARPGRPGA